MMRYTYKGDKLTEPELVGLQCDPVRRPDGKCIVSVKMATALVVDGSGRKHVVLRRKLRLNKQEDEQMGEIKAWGELSPEQQQWVDAFLVQGDTTRIQELVALGYAENGHVTDAGWGQYANGTHLPPTKSEVEPDDKSELVMCWDCRGTGMGSVPESNCGACSGKGMREADVDDYRNMLDEMQGERDNALFEVQRLQAELAAANERAVQTEMLMGLSFDVYSNISKAHEDNRQQVYELAGKLNNKSHDLFYALKGAEAANERATKAESALDDLQHDIGVFAFCGTYMDKDDKESLRSDDTIPLLETMEQIKDKRIEMENLLDHIAQEIVHKKTNRYGRWAHVQIGGEYFNFNLDDKEVVWPKSPIMEALRQVWHWKHPKEDES